MYRVLSLILIVIVIWGSDSALSQPITHHYFGGGVFQSSFDIEDVQYQAGFLNGTETITFSSGDSDDIGWQLVYGYQFRKHWGVEAQLFDTGDYVQQGPRQVEGLNLLFLPGTADEFTSEFSFGGQAATTNSIRGFSVLGTAVWPITHNLSIKGKLGFGFVSAISKVRISTEITEQDVGDLPIATGTGTETFEINESNVPIIFGLEANYKVGWKWGIGVFWHRLQGVEGSSLSGETDVDMAGVQVTFNY